jgi:hypothetical protein
MLEAQRSTEETKHCKSQTKRRVEERIKEILRDKPREECAGDDQYRQHEPEDYFGFIIVPNPPKGVFFTIGGGKIEHFIFGHAVLFNLCGCKGTKKISYMQQKKVHFFEPPPKNKILKKNACALAYVRKK